MTAVMTGEVMTVVVARGVDPDAAWHAALQARRGLTPHLDHPWSGSDDTVRQLLVCLRRFR